MRRPTILLADDHPMLCRAIQKLLEPEYDVVGNVRDGRTLVSTAAELKPDLVLLDIAMPVLNGLEAGRELKRLMPDVKLIFLTMNRDPDIESEAFRIGASGYVIKSSISEELLGTVRNMMREPDKG